MSKWGPQVYLREKDKLRDEKEKLKGNNAANAIVLARRDIHYYCRQHLLYFFPLGSFYMRFFRDGDRADALLRQMCQEFIHGNQIVKPNPTAFNVVLESFLEMASSSPVASERAESLLHQMKAMYDSGQVDTAKPTIEAYNLVLKCFDKSSSKNPEFGQRAEALLHDMQTHCQPNRFPPSVKNLHRLNPVQASVFIS